MDNWDYLEEVCEKERKGAEEGERREGEGRKRERE